MSEEIAHKIREHIAAFCIEELENVKLESKFTDELGADSIDIIEIVMLFERIFNIEIPDSETAKILTVNDMIILVTNLVTEKQTRIKK